MESKIPKLQAEVIDSTGVTINQSINFNSNSIKRFDISTKSNHFHIFPYISYPISDLFIYPNLEYFDIIEIEPKYVEISTIEDLLNKIESNKITIIQGGYGSGKTILAKKVNFDLLEKLKVFYFYATDLEIYLQGTSLDSEFDLENIPTLLIIDSIDELNNSNTSLKERSAELITNISKALKSNHKLLVTTRLLQSEVDKAISNYSEIFYDIGILSFGVITINPFEKPHIKEWLSNYSIYKESSESKFLFDYSEIKNWKKGLQSAFNNPLLLFLFCENFIRKPHYDIYDIYALYSDFVNKTVKGKFALEKKSGSQQLKNLHNEYRSILKKIAFNILESNLTNNYSLTSDNEYLDPNTELFYISESQLEATLKFEIDQFINKSSDNKKDNAVLKNNMLNCYFFEFSANNWRFKDNNILFYLIAESFYEIFKKNSTLENSLFYSSVLKLCNITINPIIIELLLQNLKNEKRSSEVSSKLGSMINEGYFINIDKIEHIQNISKNKITCDVLLSIIYLNTNKPDNNLVSYFVKRLAWYTSLIKIIDNKIPYLVKRFFKQINLTNIEFRRINLSGYNLDYSHFNKVTFIQNKIFQSRFNYVVFENCKFYLSDIESSEFSNLSGEIEFSSCIIKHLIIKDSNNLEFKFSRCLVQDVQFISKNRSEAHDLKLIFNNCDIRQMKIHNSNVMELTLFESFFDTIDLDGSFLKDFITDNSICRSKKDYNGNGQTVIKNKENRNSFKITVDENIIDD